MTILHKDIKPVAGDPNAGAHVLHYYTFTTEANMYAGTDAVLGAVVYTAADVGRVARVGTVAPSKFYVLINHAGPVFSPFGGVFTRIIPPTINDDSGDGYTVGSLWYDTVGKNAYTCVDPTLGAAVWHRVTPAARTITAGNGLTGGGDFTADRTLDVVANADGSIVVNANDIQVGVLASDAQHGTRGGSTLHALVTDSANGFLDKDVFDGQLGKNKQWQRVWRETFKGALAPMLQSNASGTGAQVQSGVAAAGYEGIGRLIAGTSSTGAARIYSNGNWFYSTYVDFVVLEVIANPVGPLPDGTEDYRMRMGCGLPSGSESGFSFTFDRAASTTNWQITRWNAGVATHTNTSAVLDLNRHRFRIVYNRAAASAEFFYDGVSVGTVSTLPVIVGEYWYVGEIRKLLGTTNREMYLEYSTLDIKYTTARPG